MDIFKAPAAIVVWMTMAAAGVSQANVINVNFCTNGRYHADEMAFGRMDKPSMQAPVPYAGQRFNDFSRFDAPMRNLVDSQGNRTKIGLTKVVSETEIRSHAYDGPLGNMADSYLYIRAAKGQSTPPSAEFAIRGFKPKQVIAGITFVSTGDKRNQSSEFTVNGEVLTVVDSPGGANAKSFVEGENYVTFTDLAADSRGRINVSFVSSSNGEFACLNGIQIQLEHDADEPEPAKPEAEAEEPAPAEPEVAEPEAPEQPEAKEEEEEEEEEEEVPEPE